MLGLSPISSGIKSRFAGWQEAAREQWAEAEQAAAVQEAAYAVVRRENRAEAKAVLHQPVPRVDRQYLNLDRAKAFIAQPLKFELSDGSSKTITGADFLNFLVTPDSVNIADLQRLADSREDISRERFEALGRSWGDLCDNVLPTLGGQKRQFNELLKQAHRDGIVYQLFDTSSKRVGKTYFGVPQEVRQLLPQVKSASKDAASSTASATETLVSDLKTALGEVNPKTMDGELLESLCTVVRSANAPQNGLDGLGYGDVPADIRGSKAFQDSNATTLPSALLSFFETASAVGDENWKKIAEKLCLDGVNAQIIRQKELDDSRSLILSA